MVGHGSRVRERSAPPEQGCRRAEDSKGAGRHLPLDPVEPLLEVGVASGQGENFRVGPVEVGLQSRRLMMQILVVEDEPAMPLLDTEDSIRCSLGDIETRRVRSHDPVLTLTGRRRPGGGRCDR